MQYSPDNPFPVCGEVTTRTDSRHFDSPAELRLFEDVFWRFGEQVHQTRQLFDPCRPANDCGRIFQDPDISKNIFHFPASPALNDTLGAYRPTSGMGSLNSVET